MSQGRKVSTNHPYSPLSLTIHPEPNKVNAAKTA